MIQRTGYRARTQAELDEAVRRAEQRQVTERVQRFARSLDYHAAVMDKVEELVKCYEGGMRPDDLRPVLIVSWFKEVLHKVEGR